MQNAQFREESRRHYIVEVAERIDRVLARTGIRPGALATLYCSAFVGMARKVGATRTEAEKLLHRTWERFDAAEDPYQGDIAAKVDVSQ